MMSEEIAAAWGNANPQHRLKKYNRDVTQPLTVESFPRSQRNRLRGIGRIVLKAIGLAKTACQYLDIRCKPTKVIPIHAATFTSNFFFFDFPQLRLDGSRT